MCRLIARRVRSLRSGYGSCQRYSLFVLLLLIVRARSDCHERSCRHKVPAEEDNVDNVFSRPTVSPFPTITPSPTLSPTRTATPTKTPVPTNTPVPTSTRIPTLTPTLTASPTITPVPTSTPLPTTTRSPIPPTQTTVSPTTTSGPTKICDVGDDGSFGSEEGTDSVVQYYFQMETTPQVNETTANSDLLPATETAITESLLPGLFPDQCDSPKSGRRSLQVRRRLVEVLGLSARPPDLVLSDVSCQIEKVSDGNSCFLVDGAVTLFTDTTLDSAVEEQIQEFLKDVMGSGAFDDIDERIVKISYINETEFDLNPDPGTGTDDTTGNGDDGGLPTYGHVFIGVGIFLGLVAIYFVLDKRWKREEESVFQSDSELQDSLVSGEVAAAELARISESDEDVFDGLEEDDSQNGEENPTDSEQSSPHDSDVYVQDDGRVSYGPAIPEDPVDGDVEELLSSLTFSSESTVPVRNSIVGPSQLQMQLDEAINRGDWLLVAELSKQMASSDTTTITSSNTNVLSRESQPQVQLDEAIERGDWLLVADLSKQMASTTSTSDTLSAIDGGDWVA